MAKSFLKSKEKPSDAFPVLIKKAKKADHLHFAVESGSIVIKEKPSSTSILHKIALSKITQLTIISGELALGFEHMEEAWVLVADNGADLTTWAKSITHLVEEAAKQDQAVNFPEFEATESGLTADIDFAKDEISYDYKPLAYAKRAAEIMKVFDLGDINIDEMAEGGAKLKRERSTEVLSDDD